MRRISADILFTADAAPMSNAVVVCDDEGKILEIGPADNFDPQETEKYEGTIVPGFVNAHCHLELSFMKGAIPRKTGLISFVKHVISIRESYSQKEQMAAIEEAESEMLVNGIVAVGDISNDQRSFFQKAGGRIRYHTFVELFDLGPEMTDEALRKGKEVLDAARKIAASGASLTPHAPYSCTPRLIRKTDRLTLNDAGILSIHLQEQEDENLLFTEKKGAWLDFLSEMGCTDHWIKAGAESSLHYMLSLLSPENKKLFVHNTFTSARDIDFALENGGAVFWVFCPNANLYIEGRLPDYPLFVRKGAKGCIGTDSLASNDELSVWREIQTIKSHYPEIPLETLLTWGSINGAEALGMDKELGSISPGKKPGLVLIEGLSSMNDSVMDTRIKRLI